MTATATATATATYTKLHSGEWGIRVTGTPTVGATVTVTRKDGESRTETVRRVLWAGNGVSLCAIGERERRSSYPRSYRSYDRDSYVCRVCGHDGDMCADMDCTCKACGGMMR